MRFFRLVFVCLLLISGISFSFKEDSFYTSLNLQKLGLKEGIFNKAMKGMRKLILDGTLQDSSKISIVDFTQTSTAKRLYIINLKDTAKLYQTYVAHGKGTGQNIAKHFSNIPNSHQSSLGFYKTLNTYIGKHGYSLKLEGLENDINDLAESRAIVLHGAKYVSESFINKYGRLGRSFGCPSVPVELSKSIIDSIKEGTCLFIYANDSVYIKNTKLL